VPALVVNERWKMRGATAARISPGLCTLNATRVARLRLAIRIQAGLAFTPQANLAFGGRGFEGILYHVDQHPAEQDRDR